MSDTWTCPQCGTVNGYTSTAKGIAGCLGCSYGRAAPHAGAKEGDTMSIQIETYTRCVSCKKQMSTQSPPPDEHYRNGALHISEGSTVLLDNRVRGRSSFAGNLEGYYCNIDCFIKKVRELRVDKP